MDTVSQHKRVEENRQDERGRQPGMEYAGIRRWLLLQILHATFTNPSPNLSDEQTDEHHQEPAPQLSPEYCHGETCLRHGKPRLFVELFGFNRSQGSVEESLKPVKEETNDQEAEVRQDLSKTWSE